MVDKETTEMTWRPTNPDGSIGEPVTLTVPVEDARVITAEWKHVKALPSGPEKEAGLASIRTQMDMLALGDASIIHPTLYVRDPQEGARRRDEAIERVEKAADPDIKREAEKVVRALAYEKAELTTDDVWARMTQAPEEGRMMGAVMKWAERNGLIAYTDRTIASELPQNHKRPVRIWRSLVFDAQQRIS